MTTQIFNLVDCLTVGLSDLVLEYNCWYTVDLVTRSVFDALSIGSSLVAAVVLCMKRLRSSKGIVGRRFRKCVCFFCKYQSEQQLNKVTHLLFFLSIFNREYNWLYISY